MGTIHTNTVLGTGTACGAELERIGETKEEPASLKHVLILKDQDMPSRRPDE